MEESVWRVEEGASHGREKHSQVLRVAETEIMDAIAQWDYARPNGSASELGWLLCAGRQISSGLNIADDSGSRAGRRRREYTRGIATSKFRSIGCRGDARHTRVLSCGRSSSHCGFGVRN